MNSTRFILLIVHFFFIEMLLVTPYAHGELPFSDDFEDGDLVGWTVGGRQNGTGDVNVVDRDGSKMGHVFHQDFTEITLEKTFSFNPSLRFTFDMEVNTSGNNSPDSTSYAMAGVQFRFFRATGERIGRIIYYIDTTSTYPFTAWPTTPHQITPDVLDTYSLDINDLVTQSEADPSNIVDVNMQFFSYASGWSYDMKGDVWVDNVTVTPEPTSSILFLLGAATLGIRYYSRKK